MILANFINYFNRILLVYIHKWIIICIYSSRNNFVINIKLLKLQLFILLIVSLLTIVEYLVFSPLDYNGNCIISFIHVYKLDNYNHIPRLSKLIIFIFVL